MVDEFPSNSNRDKESRVITPSTSKAQPAIEGKKVEQITTGEVLRRKKPLGARLKALFISGDSKTVWGFIAGDVLVPAVKDLIADATTQGVERMVFGEARRRGPRGFGGGYVGHNRYDGYFRPGGTPSSPWSSNRPEMRRDISPQGRSSHNFDEIILESRGEAEQVVDTLRDMVSQYGSASVSDLYGLVGISSAYTDQKYGWNNLQGANVQHVRGGAYLLNLPRPMLLD